MEVVQALSHPAKTARRLLKLVVTWPNDAAGNAAYLPTHHYRTARQLRPVEVDELVQGYVGGATVFELATQFGIDRRTVGQHLRKRGIDTRPPRLRPEDVPDAAELYRSGWSLAKIAHKFGLKASGATTVRRYLLEAGVVMRKPWERG